MPSIDPRSARQPFSRRSILRTFALLGGGLALSAACGQQPPAPAKPAETKPAEAKPAEAAKPAAPAAPVPTQAAPAAAKPAESKPAASGEAPRKGGTLRVGLTVEAVTLDPKLQIKPSLAESWSYADPKTLVFKLRQGVKFHDGTDFDADAVKFNFDRMKNPDTKSLRTGEIANVENAEVVDKSTVKL